jgi:hypothetical protein
MVPPAARVAFDQARMSAGVSIASATTANLVGGRRPAAGTPERRRAQVDVGALNLGVAGIADGRGSEHGVSARRCERVCGGAQDEVERTLA